MWKMQDRLATEDETQAEAVRAAAKLERAEAVKRFLGREWRRYRIKHGWSTWRALFVAAGGKKGMIAERLRRQAFAAAFKVANIRHRVRHRRQQGLRVAMMLQRWMSHCTAKHEKRFELCARWNCCENHLRRVRLQRGWRDWHTEWRAPARRYATTQSPRLASGSETSPELTHELTHELTPSRESPAPSGPPPTPSEATPCASPVTQAAGAPAASIVPRVAVAAESDHRSSQPARPAAAVTATALPLQGDGGERIFSILLGHGPTGWDLDEAQDTSPTGYHVIHPPRRCLVPSTAAPAAAATSSPPNEARAASPPRRGGGYRGGFSFATAPTTPQRPEDEEELAAARGQPTPAMRVRAVMMGVVFEEPAKKVVLEKPVARVAEPEDRSRRLAAVPPSTAAPAAAATPSPPKEARAASARRGGGYRGAFSTSVQVPMSEVVARAVAARAELDDYSSPKQPEPAPPRNRDNGGSFSQIERRATLTKIKEAGLSCAEARAAGYSCADAKAVGYTLVDAKAAGWSLEELLNVGYINQALAMRLDAANSEVTESGPEERHSPQAMDIRGSAMGLEALQPLSQPIQIKPNDPSSESTADASQAPAFFTPATSAASLPLPLTDVAAACATPRWPNKPQAPSAQGGGYRGSFCTSARVPESEPPTPVMKVLGVMVGARAEKLHRASSFTADPGDLTPDTSTRATSTTDAPAASPTAVKKVEDVAPLRGATLDDVGGNPLSALADLWLGMSESISKSVETVAETVASAVESLDLGLDLGMQTSSMRHTALELVIDRAARRIRNQEIARAFESWANLWRHLVHHRRLLACSHRFTSLRLAEAFSYWARPPDWVWKNIEFSNKQIACNWWRPRGLRQGVHTWRSWLVWRAHEKKQREKSQRRREPLSPMGMQLRSQLLRRRMASNRVQGGWRRWKGVWLAAGGKLGETVFERRKRQVVAAARATAHKVADVRHRRQQGLRLAHSWQSWLAHCTARHEARAELYTHLDVGEDHLRRARLRHGWRSWRQWYVEWDRLMRVEAPPRRLKLSGAQVAPASWDVGDEVLYGRADGNVLVPATVRAVHTDNAPDLYYTIEVNGDECSTPGDRLHAGFVKPPTPLPQLPPAKKAPQADFVRTALRSALRPAHHATAKGENLAAGARALALPPESLVALLRQLQGLLDDGLITPEQFEAKREELLARGTGAADGRRGEMFSNSENDTACESRRGGGAGSAAAVGATTRGTEAAGDLGFPETPNKTPHELRSDIFKWLEREELMNELTNEEDWAQTPGGSPRGERPPRKTDFLSPVGPYAAAPAAATEPSVSSMSRGQSFGRVRRGLGQATLSFGRTAAKTGGYLKSKLSFNRKPSNPEALERAYMMRV